MLANLKPYFILMRVDKPIGIALLLWPTLWALWLASSGNPSPTVLAIFISGVVIMRSAGCIINDFADRHVDGFVARTQQRPLATGVIRSQHALALFGCLILLAFTLVLFLNRLCLYL